MDFQNGGAAWLMDAMTATNHPGNRDSKFMRLSIRPFAFLLPLIWCWLVAATAAGSPTDANGAVENNSPPVFNVVGYEVGSGPALATNVVIPLLSGHTGTNVSLKELVQAAADLHEEYRRQGHP